MEALPQRPGVGETERRCLTWTICPKTRCSRRRRYLSNSPDMHTPGYKPCAFGLRVWKVKRGILSASVSESMRSCQSGHSGNPRPLADCPSSPCVVPSYLLGVNVTRSRPLPNPLPVRLHPRHFSMTPPLDRLEAALGAPLQNCFMSTGFSRKAAGSRAASISLVFGPYSQLSEGYRLTGHHHPYRLSPSS
jgi:hypothetical protein